GRHATLRRLQGEVGAPFAVVVGNALRRIGAEGRNAATSGGIPQQLVDVEGENHEATAYRNGWSGVVLRLRRHCSRAERARRRRAQVEWQSGFFGLWTSRAPRSKGGRHARPTSGR